MSGIANGKISIEGTELAQDQGLKVSEQVRKTAEHRLQDVDRQINKMTAAGVAASRFAARAGASAQSSFWSANKAKPGARSIFIGDNKKSQTAAPFSSRKGPKAADKKKRRDLINAQALRRQLKDNQAAAEESVRAPSVSALLKDISKGHRDPSALTNKASDVVTAAQRSPGIRKELQQALGLN